MYNFSRNSELIAKGKKIKIKKTQKQTNKEQQQQQKTTTITTTTTKQTTQTHKF